MKSKILLSVAFIILGTPIWAQNSNTRPSKKNKAEQSPEKNGNTSLFKILGHSNEIDVKNDIRDAIFLELDFAELARINKEKPSSLILDLPLSNNSNATFYLNTAKVVSDNFSILTGNNEKVDYTPGLYYQGTVAGNTPSLAAWSLFDHSIMTVFSWNNQNYVLGLWKHESNVLNNIYILYKDSDVLYQRKFECMADKLIKEATAKATGTDNPELLFTNCVKIYFECDYEMYTDNGNSVTNVGNFVTGMFNVIKTLYTNESIGVEISQIYAWSASDPYIPYTTSTDLLDHFQTYRTTFTGDLAHLLTTRNLGAGGLAYLDVLCTPSYAYGMTNIDNAYDTYPNYSWTVEAVTHELGHN
ncbi:MAG: zinc-dependent metalloprotease, partial [Bacteroidetes bacterium]|nr:zinc-dependent metalloprotease [Bacteroidota bacterium]